MSEDCASVCGWAMQSELERVYHDQEWGFLKTDDRTLFEFVVLESAQAGLSWRTILSKREGYRQHYQNFEPERVAAFTESQIEGMLNDAGVIRNRAKIEASISNAKVFIHISKQFDGFSRYLLSFMQGRPVINEWHSMEQIPAKTELSDRIAKDLKKRGFRFFGSTIVYAYLQACGYVNDHLLNCAFRAPSLDRLSDLNFYEQHTHS